MPRGLTTKEIVDAIMVPVASQINSPPVPAWLVPHPHC